jgi:hypothetical protein
LISIDDHSGEALSNGVFSRSQIIESRNQCNKSGNSEHVFHILPKPGHTQFPIARLNFLRGGKKDSQAGAADIVESFQIKNQLCSRLFKPLGKLIFQLRGGYGIQPRAGG